MSQGFVTFAFGQRIFATPLNEIREVVRLVGLTELPGMAPPLTGVITLRGNPLPVLDVRGAGADRDTGDILVLDDGSGQPIGIAVDGVVAVLDPDQLAESGAAPPRALPDYVIDVRQGPDGPVLLVDLHRLVRLTAARSDVALEDRGFGQSGQALADTAGSGLPDALHRL
ncbi:MAG TPA: chemotaxis protein CheW [Mycobacteriales bacterium]|nr:chemotaxis protein CheW [Mycobacteriales bacterium]